MIAFSEVSFNITASLDFVKTFTNMMIKLSWRNRAFYDKMKEVSSDADAAQKAMTSSHTMRTFFPQPLARGEAPGKIILFGEHAVVYGRPAIAAPVQQVRARAEIWPADACVVDAVDLNRRIFVARARRNDPLALIVRLVCERLHRPLPRWRIRVTSEIPPAAGLGSGAAISTAVVRAMLAGFDEELDNAEVSALVYEVEKIYHGAPSGIDNTVVAYEQPVWFVRGQPPRPFAVARPLHWLIADTGVASPTRIAVGDVRRAWEQDPARFEMLFDAAGDIARQARTAIEKGDVAALGLLMDANQRLLAEMGVSSPELERLMRAARDAGALGAKLSGAGRGGNLIALVHEDQVERVQQALLRAGAVRVIATIVR